MKKDEPNPAYEKPKSLNPPNGRFLIWCYFCNWHMRDSNTARKRLGQHIVDRHPEEMRFLKTERPPEIIDV